MEIVVNLFIYFSYMPFQSNVHYFIHNRMMIVPNLIADMINVSYE